MFICLFVCLLESCFSLWKKMMLWQKKLLSGNFNHVVPNKLYIYIWFFSKLWHNFHYCLTYLFKTLSVLILVLIFIALYFFRGQTFILEHLRMEDVSCYWERLLTDFSKLLKYKPKRKSNYNQIIHGASRSELWLEEWGDHSSFLCLYSCYSFFWTIQLLFKLVLIAEKSV